MTNLLEEADIALGELIRMHKLNAELLETLSVTAQWLRNYAENHNIPFPNSSTYETLIHKADRLIEEIANNQKPTDGFLQRKPTDTDLTESCPLVFVVYIRGL